MAGYGVCMIDTAVSSANLETVEAVLRNELVQADAAAETVAPVLRHLLASDDNSLFSDEIIARIRGMMRDMAGQLLDRLVLAGGEEELLEHDAGLVSALTGAFVENSVFLRHLHSLALEWQLTERLHARLGLDPVLSPLVQTLVASQDETMADLAMRLLASQSRFCQSQRRMKMPLVELPGDLLHSALLAMRALAGSEEEADRRAATAEAGIRADYDEASTRLGMISRLVTGMGGAAVTALSVTHAGTAIFLSALAIGSGQDRDVAVLSTNESQMARFALGLRSAGLKHSGIEEQFLALYPDFALPEGFERLNADRAAAILAAGGGCPGD